MSFSALYSTNVLYRGTLKLLAFLFLSFAAIFRHQQLTACSKRDFRL